MHPLNKIRRDRGFDMSTIREPKPPMNSEHRMYVRCWTVVSIGLVAMAAVVLLSVSLLTHIHSAERITNNITQRDEYTAAIKACGHAMPSNVSLCVANVNQNFVTGG